MQTEYIEFLAATMAPKRAENNKYQAIQVLRRVFSREHMVHRSKVAVVAKSMRLCVAKMDLETVASLARGHAKATTADIEAAEAHAKTTLMQVGTRWTGEEVQLHPGTPVAQYALAFAAYCSCGS